MSPWQRPCSLVVSFQNVENRTRHFRQHEVKKSSVWISLNLLTVSDSHWWLAGVTGSTALAAKGLPPFHRTDCLSDGTCARKRYTTSWAAAHGWMGRWMDRSANFVDSTCKRQYSIRNDARRRIQECWCPCSALRVQGPLLAIVLPLASVVHSKEMSYWHLSHLFA